MKKRKEGVIEAYQRRHNEKIKLINDVSRIVYKHKGYEVEEDYDFVSATHPHEVSCFNTSMEVLNFLNNRPKTPKKKKKALVHYREDEEDYRKSGQTDYECTHSTYCGYVRKKVTRDIMKVTCIHCLREAINK